MEYLINALPNVLAQMECTLLIVGEFYRREEAYRRRISRRALGERVRIVNRYVPNDEAELYFCAADLIILPYVTASQCGVLPIAQSFNLPAVATQVGGLLDQVAHGSTGFLVPPRDSEAFANAIPALFQEHKAEGFGRNIERARSCNSWSRVAEAITSLA